MTENDGNIYTYALIQDRSIVSPSILETGPNADKHEDSITKTDIINPEVSYVCQGENFNIKPEDVLADDNLIVVDSKESNNGVEASKVTCLSDCWQASGLKKEQWKFIDDNAPEETSDEVSAFLITGSKAELLIENTRTTGKDIVPKGNMTYVSKLVSLFGKRNKELQNVVSYQDSSYEPLKKD